MAKMKLYEILTSLGPDAKYTIATTNIEEFMVNLIFFFNSLSMFTNNMYVYITILFQNE